MRNKGFTLVELLVVMAIMGILAVITLANFSTSQAKGRDVQRKSDLKQISTALEAYATDHGGYPPSNVTGQILACGCETQVACLWGGTLNREFCDDSSTVYMKEIPDDTVNSRHYCYWSDEKSFRLYAGLENPKDAECLVKNNGNCSPIATCNGKSYTYGVSSLNTTPVNINSLLVPTSTPIPTSIPTPTPIPAQAPTSTPIPIDDTLPLPTSTCFLAGTGVVTVAGNNYHQKPIEKINISDKVLSFNPLSKILNSSVVQNIYVSETNNYYRLSTKETNVKATADHPFLTKGGVFQKIKNLMVGDSVYLLCNQFLCEQKIIAKELIFEKVKVYNLSVNGNNTFFANGFAVHNKQTGPILPPPMY